MPLDKNKIVAEASKYAQKGQFDKAIKCYERVVADDPKDVRVRLKLGETQQKKGDLADAAETFHLCAQAYADQGFALKAVAVYKQIARLTPDDGRVPERLAALYQQLGLLSDAMGQMQLVAQAHERAGDEPKVIEALRRMADLDPENVATSVKLGELYARGGQPAAALEQFRRAAAALKKTSRTDEYLKVAERVASLSPQDLGLTRELANAYLARKDTKRALAKLQLCFKADPKDVETLTLLAQAFRDLGQVSKTVSVFKELAHVQVERGRADEARATFRSVLELAPDDAEALEGAGQRRAAPGAPPAREEAAEVVTRTPWPSPVIERTPPPAAKPAPPAPSPPAPAPVNPARDAAPLDVARLLTEIDVYLKYGLTSRALEHVNRILAVDAGHPDARARLRDLHARGGDLASAAREGALAVRGYLGAGRGPEALSALNRLRELAPDYPELSELAIAAGEPTSPADPEGETVAFEEGEAMVVGEDDIESVDEDALALSVAVDEGGEIVPEDLLAAGVTEEQPETVSFEEPQELVSIEEPQDLVSFEEPQELPSIEEPQELVSFEEQQETVSPEEPAPIEERDLTLDEPLVTPDEPLFAPDEPLFAPDEPLVTPDEPLFAPEPALVAAPPQPSPRGGEGVPPSSRGGERASPSPSSGGEKASPSPAPGGKKASPSPSRGVARASPPLSRKAGEGQGGGDPQATPAPTPPPPPEPDAESLGEADFFIQQGLLEEARELLGQLAAAYPGHPALAPRLSALEDAEAAEFEEFVESTEAAKRSPGGDPQPANVGQVPAPARVPASPPVAPSPRAAARPPPVQATAPAPPSELEPHQVQPLQVAGGDTFDLGQELASELAADDVKAPEEFQYSVADVFSQFKKGVEQTVRPEDGQTHYDLGIAYKEMGLLDDAVQEFETALAAGGGKKDLDCLTMVGLCRMAQEEPFQAVDAFSRALRAEGLNVDSAKALHYELGLAYEAAGDPEAALFFLQKIIRLDPRYRDVGRAVARLGGGPGRSPDAPAAAAPASPAGPEATPAPAPAGGRPGPRKKIGYV
ncbi:MAG TPA: tetratricopeptide repeat protein [Anaeromyxobacteraceae bacterium]|jgi:tetratricopeptide (TPR) repeat protein|nr:tetratricopeptide repeat protein [Anaeromyxobacteraceae bacterium]